MKIALIAPPHIAVPPADYGGTELFVAQLAEGLQKAGAQVIVYANAESTVNVERRSLYKQSQWPIKNTEHALIRATNHESWAIQDAAKECDIIHVQSAHALTFSRFVEKPTVLTLHGPHDPKLSQFYGYYPDVYYVAISNSQCESETMPRIRTIYHGVDPGQYTFREQKQRYLSFIGRLALTKGAHLAIDVARQTGIPLKIAGDVQPQNREYYENKIEAANRWPTNPVRRIRRFQNEKRTAQQFNCNALPYSMARALRAGDGGSHGMRHSSACHSGWLGA